jgi:tetratricopeptide (TPR) repeat protein
VRVLSAAADVIYIVPGTGAVKTMGYAALPSLPVLPGNDASYPVNSTYSNEYFFQNNRALMPNLPGNRPPAPYPWESAVYEDGYAYAEASTAPLVYRKMFCWGSGQGGRRWQDFLSLPGEEYLEVQAGLAPTQLHTADIAGGAAVDWVQAFTAIETDPAQTHQKDYLSAVAHTEACLVKRISPALLETALTAGRAAAALPAEEILHLGTGWGALEKRFDHGQGQIPVGLLFPDESIGEDEAPWAELLRTGALLLRKAADGPGSFAVHENWETLLKKSPVRTGDWLTPYHLGVIAFERGDREAARDWWKRSLEAEENPWAYRNLGITAEPEQALEYYKKTFELSGECAEDYIRCLLEAQGEEAAAEALDAYMKRRGRTTAELSEALREVAARIALSRRDDQTLDLIFSIEPAHIREGNTALIEIWLEREAARLVKNGACASLVKAREQVRGLLAEGKIKAPENIDFRMF